MVRRHRQRAADPHAGHPRRRRGARCRPSPLDETGCPEVIDAKGKWVVPGFVDVHTHYDAEVLLDPGLRESVRHGVTTVLLGMCSLSTVYANADDAADLFSRVEAVPRKFVLGALQDNKSWSTPAEYVEAIDSLPLGPNVSSLLGHSDLRTSVLGLDRATTPDVQPTDAELDKMAALLDDALEAGMLGMSGMDAAIDKLDGDRFRSRALPSTFATWRERRKLIKVLRKRGRILQSAPNVAKAESGLLFFLSSSPMFGLRKAVRMSLLVSADAKSMPLAVHVFGLGTRLMNFVLRSKVRFQHLPVPFELYSDGIDLPVFEEFGAGTAALHLRDQLERNDLAGRRGLPAQVPPPVRPRQARTVTVAQGLSRSGDRRMPRRDADRQELRCDRRGARTTPARRVPRRPRRER